MKTATIRQVRNNFAAVLAWIAEGEEVTILNRKTPVARICPPHVPAPTRIRMPDFEARAAAIFGKKETRFAEAVLKERQQSRW